MNQKDLWILFLGTNDEEVLNILSGIEANIQKTVTKLQYVNADEKARYEFDMKRKALLDHYNSMATA